MEHRFDQQSLELLGEMERILINACNGSISQPSGRLQELYRSDIEFQRLEAQLKVLPDLVHTVNQQSKTQGQVAIKEVTTMSTICDLMNTSSFGKSMFSEVHRLLLLYLTVPMTSATAERTFSALRRLKNYLRANMTQKRLNHVIMLSCYTL